MTRRTAAVRCAAALLLSAAASPHAAAQLDAPFRTRNLSPMISVYGLPAWERAERGTEVGVTSELANHYRLSSRGSETLVLDGETWRSSLFVRHAFDGPWSVGLEVPYYQQSGGVLDDLIDGWHSAFGLPDGGRNRRAEDQLLFLAENGPGTYMMLDHRVRGLGDVQLSVGRELGGDGGLLLKASVKLPTGDEDMLAGSGAADLAVTLTRAKAVSLGGMPAAFFWGVGAIALGEPERIGFDAGDGTALGLLGGSLRPWPKLGFKAQLDVHGPLYDSRLEELDDPGVQATIGGWWRISKRGVLEAAVNEDLSVSTSPDVVIHMALRWSL
ncbi:MAG: DUF3187 family protein [Gammaproteobacteria bacterium]|nr:DUF3187 family protein [Gammaproteobacteria bacterium]